MATNLLQNYMTPTEAAAELGICARTLERWHRLHEGPPRVKLGRRTLYHREAVAKWIASRQQPDTEAA